MVYVLHACNGEVSRQSEWQFPDVQDVHGNTKCKMCKPGHKLLKPIKRGFIHLHSSRFTSLLVTYCQSKL